MSKSGPIVLGLVGAVIGAGAALLPISDDYSSFGLGFGTQVTLECGNPFSDDFTIRDDGFGITSSDRIFELDDGLVVTAREACEDSRSTARVVALVGLIGGGLLFLVGLLWPDPTPPPPVRDRRPPQSQRPSSSQPPPPRPRPASPRPAPQPRMTGGSRGSGTPIDPAAAQPGTPAAPVPPSERKVSSSSAAAGGDSWWSQPLDGTLPDASPLPERGGGPLSDPALPAAPAAPIPDAVIGSLPSSPVSGRHAPSVDPTPAAAPAPIPDAVSGEFARSGSSVDDGGWGIVTDEPDRAGVGDDHDHDHDHPDDLGDGELDSSDDEEPVVLSGVTSPANRVEQFQLSDGQLLLVDDVSVVGRRPASPISYPDAVLVTVDDPTVSKSHAAFGRTGGELWVEDLHSRNGLQVIRLDGSRESSPPGESTPLAVGDAVRLGDRTTLTVTLGHAPDGSNASTKRRAP